MSEIDLINKMHTKKQREYKLPFNSSLKIELNSEIIKLAKEEKHLKTTPKGLQALGGQMKKIQQATTIVTANLSQIEKMELIRLLHKLNDFYQPIYDRSIETENLLETALTFKIE